MRRLATRAATALFSLFILAAAAYATVRVMRSGWLFFYTEGNVMASIGALLEAGSLAAMYPNDGWATAPLIMTLYPPVYLVIAALLAAVSGTQSTLLMPRLISIVAMLLVVVVLVRLARQRGVPAWLVAVPLGALLLAPPVSNLLGSAQVDVLALCWTVIGVTLVALADRTPSSRVWISLPFFLLAFFTKQSFVAAPAALIVAMFLGGRRSLALQYGAVLGVAAATGLLLLERATGGGYLMNTVGALTSATSGANLITTLVQSRPLQWLPVVLLLILWAAPGFRPGVLELWALTSWFLNVAATVKVGASVNYLLEPLFALLVLAVVRLPARAADHPAVAVRPRVMAVVTASLVVWAAAATAPRARQAAGVARAMWGQEWQIRLDGFETGYPLVDAQYVPAVRHEGTLPYLNDTYAFGVLLEVGRWDAAPLLDALRDHEVPFILTDTDLRMGTRPQGIAPGAEGFAHFWRIPSIQRAIRENYELTTETSPWVWRPRAPVDGE